MSTPCAGRPCEKSYAAHATLVANQIEKQARTRRTLSQVAKREKPATIQVTKHLPRRRIEELR